MYDTGNFPENMMESKYIAIPKKPGTVEFKEHHTIARMSEVGRMILRVIGKRIKRRIMKNVDEKQYGFRKEKGATNAIFLLRMITKIAIGI